MSLEARRLLTNKKENVEINIIESINREPSTFSRILCYKLIYSSF